MSRYVIAIDPSGNGPNTDCTACVLFDTKKRSIVWTSERGKYPFPFWLKWMLRLRMAQVVAESR